MSLTQVSTKLTESILGVTAPFIIVKCPPQGLNDRGLTRSHSSEFLVSRGDAVMKHQDSGTQKGKLDRQRPGKAMEEAPSDPFFQFRHHAFPVQ